MKNLICCIIVLFPLLITAQTYSTSSGGQRSQTNRAYVTPVITKTYTTPTPKTQSTQYQAPSSSNNTYRNSSGSQSSSSSSSSSGSTYSSAPVKKEPTTGYDFYQLGINEMNFGSKDQAIAYFEKAVSLDPTHAQSYLSMGLIRAKQGDAAGAEAYFSKSILVSPQYDLAYSGRGDARLTLKKFSEAIADYDKALSIQVTVRDYYFRAISKYNIKNYSEAAKDFTASITTYDEVQEGYDAEKRGGKPKPKKSKKENEVKQHREIEDDPMYINSFYYRGLSKHQLEDYSGALEDYDHAATINNKDPYGYFLKGNALLDMGQYDEAIAEYNKAIELDPEYTDAKNGISKAKSRSSNLDPTATFQSLFVAGNKLQADSKYSDAILAYTNAIKLNNKNALAYAERGYCKKNLKQYKEAIADFSRAIELDPTSEMSYYNLGVCHFKIDQQQEAIKNLLKAIELDPLREKSYTVLAATYMDLKDQKNAIANYDKAINLNPSSSNYFKRARSKASSQTKDYAGAITDYNMALQLQPDYPEAYYYRAISKKETNDFDGAIADFEKALELRPSYTEAKNNLEMTKLIKEVLSEKK